MSVFAELSPPYATIVADPPWPYSDAPMGYQRENGKRFLSYSTMSLDELAALPVADLGLIDAHLYLWTTSAFLWDAKALAESWGFTVWQPLVWCKEPMGTGGGGWFTPTAEFILACRRDFGAALRRAAAARGLTAVDIHRAVRGGSPTGLTSMWLKGTRYPNDDDWCRLADLLGLPRERAGNPAKTNRSWWVWARGPHSAKPPAFLELVEQSSPGPYVELFARQPRLGWDSWGHGYELHNSLEATP